MHMRRVLALLTLLGPALAGAQRGAAPQFEEPRGYVMIDLSDGEPISSFMEVARQLGLTEPQKRRLMDIRRLLRTQNQPFMLRLDSLRALAGVELGSRERLRRADAEALERFNRWARSVIDSIRLNNDVARAEARNVLSAEQRRRMDSLALATREPRTGNPRRRPG